MRWLMIGIAVLTFAVAGAGCGGGDDEASGDTTAITDTTTDDTTDETTTETTDTSTDTSGSDTDTTFNWASEDCQNLVKAYLGLSGAIAAASAGQDVSGQVEEFTEYVDDVPEEIRADVQTIAGAYGTFLDEIKDAGLTLGEVPTADQIQQLQEASDSLSEPDVQAATDRLSAWTNENCTG